MTLQAVENVIPEWLCFKTVEQEDIPYCGFRN